MPSSDPALEVGRKGKWKGAAGGLGWVLMLSSYRGLQAELLGEAASYDCRKL